MIAIIAATKGKIIASIVMMVELANSAVETIEFPPPPVVAKEVPLINAVPP